MPHAHRSAAAANRGRLVAVLCLGLAILAVELVGAWAANSLALLADAGHMLTDVTGVAMALVAIWLCARHGLQLGGESPLGIEVARTPSRRQRRHREVGSEGSPRQSSDPRNTNRIRRLGGVGESAIHDEARSHQDAVE